MNERGARGTNEGPASMNKDPGAQEGYKRVQGGGGRGVETSTSRYEGSAGRTNEQGGGMNVRGGVGGTNEHGGSAGGTNAGRQRGLRAPCPPPPYHYFYLFIISIFLHIFMYAFRIF